MLARSHRFHGRNSLRYVYEKGKTVRSAHLALRYCLNERRRDYRAAVVVSKKVQKTAVARNRLRRRIYAVLQGDLADNLLAYDLVITVFSAQVSDWSADKLHASVQQLLADANLRPNSHKS